MNYRLPDRYSAKQLVDTYRHFKANPDDTWFPANDWTKAGRKASEWFRWFYDCLAKKIQSKMVIAKDRSWDDVLARINWKQRNRIVIHQTDLNGLPDRLKKKLQSLISW